MAPIWAMTFDKRILAMEPEERRAHVRQCLHAMITKLKIDLVDADDAETNAILDKITPNTCLLLGPWGLG